jgi:hypothetical protein
LGRPRHFGQRAQPGEDHVFELLEVRDVCSMMCDAVGVLQSQVPPTTNPQCDAAVGRHAVTAYMDRLLGCG